ncbi:MAG: Flp family type IVb pilin [Planctomycetes bacterium]|nr:Flp family type IVb pilin [Planctomycetota bacterium]
MKNFLRRLAADEDGPTSVEYAVMLAMIIVVCVVSVRAVGVALADNFDNSNTEMVEAFN